MPTYTPDFEQVDEDRDEILGVEEEEAPPKEAVDFVFDGDDVPEELRGKTKAEAIAHYQQVKNAGKQMADLYMSSQKRPAAPPPEPEPPPKITADDFLDEGGDITQKIEKIAEHKIRPYIAEAQNNAANNMYTRQLQSTPYLNDYRDEVNHLITSQNLTPAQVANPATWALIDAHILKSHSVEIYEKYAAQKKRKPEPPTAIKGDTRGRASQNAGGKLTSEQKEFAKLLGANTDDAEKYAGYNED